MRPNLFIGKTGVDTKRDCTIALVYVYISSRHGNLCYGCFIMTSAQCDIYICMYAVRAIKRRDPSFILEAAAKVKDPANHLHYADVSSVLQCTLPKTRFEEVDFMREAVGIMASAVHFAVSPARDDVELWRTAIVSFVILKKKKKTGLARNTLACVFQRRVANPFCCS